MNTLTRQFLAVLFLPLLLLATDARAQLAPGPTDQSNPSALAQGAHPLGSYGGSSFDKINLFNGNLSLSFPLASLDGRAGLGVAVILSYNSKLWRVQQFSDPTAPTEIIYSPVYERLGLPGWTIHAGTMSVNQTAYGQSATCRDPVRTSYPNFTITKATFTAPDGTAYEFRDDLTDGKPLELINCGPQSRGRRFHSVDGTAATFLSDADISDDLFPEVPRSPSGMVVLRDGTRFRIVDGAVVQQQDRHGNHVRFEYDQTPRGGRRLRKVTDTLGREITIDYDGASAIPAQVRTKRINGVERVIQIESRELARALRQDQDPMPKSMNQLFPDLFSIVGDTVFNPRVLTAITLPSGHQWAFLYNSYGEVASVKAPAGGAIAYESPQGGVIRPPGSPQIFRRIAERRVYPDGVTLEGRTTYGDPSVKDVSEATTTVLERQVDGSGTLLAATRHTFAGSPIENFGGTFYRPWMEGKEIRTAALDTDEVTVKRTVKYTWMQRAPVDWALQSGFPEPENDPRLIKTTTTLRETGQVSNVEFDYDRYNNVTAERVFDYDGVVPLHETRRTYITSANGKQYDTDLDIHLRSLIASETVSNGAGVIESLTTFEYDQYAGDGLHAPLVDRVFDPAVAKTRNPNYTPSWLWRGNVTKVIRGAGTSEASSSYAQYDVAGNVVKTIGPRATPRDVHPYTTVLSYAPQFHFAYPTETRQCVPQRVGCNPETASLDHMLITTQTYDFWTGARLSTTGVNGDTVTYTYDDPLDRLTQETRPVGGGETQYRYSAPGLYPVTVQSRTQQQANTYSVSTVYLDGLLRPTQQEGPDGAIVETRYDGLGRAFLVSNPHRATPAATDGWTRTSFDALGRVTRVTTCADEAQTRDCTGTVMSEYAGTRVTVTDQARNQRSSVTDALGRLRAVYEPDETGALTIKTEYQYDARSNLVNVLQGQQTRTFAYDAVGRLTSSTAPETESGTTLYAYDPASNLLSRTDARSVVTRYDYDALNRVTMKSYSDGTPTVTYTYDTSAVPNAKGRLTSVSSAVSSSRSDEYDVLGRVKRSTQVTDGQSYAMSYGYDLVGNVITQTYPSGRAVTTSYDTTNRISGVSGQKSGEGTKTYASSFSYAAHSGLQAVKLGNGLWEHTNYNTRLQPLQIGLGASSVDGSVLQLDYSYGTTNNNGNVLGQTITAPGFSATQNYTYDPLNRIRTATEGGSWTQTYLYDQYGNRAVTGYVPNPALTPQSLTDFNPATNRLKNSSYDNAGNLAQDATGRIFRYDAENHQVTSNTGAATYAYDGDGRRVKKVVGGVTTAFVYNVFGQLVAEYTHSEQVAAGGTSYLTADHLRSTRIVTDSSGAVKARHDYLPFGEELSAGIGIRSASLGYGDDSTRQKFTSKERDSETGLDFFGARYFASVQGRFTSPDPLLSSGTIYDPQSWNRYTYTLNNPLKYTDPFGLYVFDDGTDEKYKKKFRQGSKDLQKARNSFKKGSEEYNRLNRALNAYGKEGVNNGVTIAFGATKTGAPAATSIRIIKPDPTGAKLTTADNPTGQDTIVTIDPIKNTSADDYVSSIGHEGSHVADGSDLVGELPTDLTSPAAQTVLNGALNLTDYVTETRAYEVTSFIAQGRGVGTQTIGSGKHEIWNSGWSQADRATKRSAGIDRVLADPAGYYKVTPTNQGRKLIE